MIITLRQIKYALEHAVHDETTAYSFKDVARIIAMDANIVLYLLRLSNRITESSSEFIEKPYTLERILAVIGLERVADELQKIDTVMVEHEDSLRRELVRDYCKAILAAKIAERLHGTHEEAQKYFLAGLLAEKLKTPTCKLVLAKSHEKIKECIHKMLKAFSTKGGDIIKDANYLSLDYEYGTLAPPKHGLEEHAGEFYTLWQEAKKRIDAVVYKA